MRVDATVIDVVVPSATADVSVVLRMTIRGASPECPEAVVDA
jgi:hypothetical protein